MFMNSYFTLASRFVKLLLAYIISKPIQDSNISEKDYIFITDEVNIYRRLKEDIKITLKTILLSID